MSKKMEEYIREYRKAFDLELPSDQLWSKIESGLNRQKIKKPLRMPFWFSIAASLIVVMVIIFISTYPKRNTKTTLVDVNPAFEKKEIRFASLIEEKKDSLQVYAMENPDLYQQFSSDLGKLNADYDDLKKELQVSPNQKFVIRAIVKNLELQLQVVNQQLSIINEVNQYKKENKI